MMLRHRIILCFAFLALAGCSDSTSSRTAPPPTPSSTASPTAPATPTAPTTPTASATFSATPVQPIGSPARSPTHTATSTPTEPSFPPEDACTQGQLSIDNSVTYPPYNAVLDEAAAVYARYMELAATVQDDRTSTAIRTAARIFLRAYPNTVLTTTRSTGRPDGSVMVDFLVTGDIEAMWYRDSAAQLNPYIDLIAKVTPAQAKYLGQLICRVIQRHAFMINSPPAAGQTYFPYPADEFRPLPIYANSVSAVFKNDPVGCFADPCDGKSGFCDQGKGRLGYVNTYNYEMDSLAYFLRLSYRFWEAMGRDDTFFPEEWLTAARSVVDLWIVEQDHLGERTGVGSPYRYNELEQCGLGNDVAFTGMTWTGFRPSDDACTYNFLVPANMFAVAALDHLTEMIRSKATERTDLDDFLGKIETLRNDIDDGIKRHGVTTVEDPDDRAAELEIYAYETDGRGSYETRDDANVPSLLSMKYLGYEPDPTIAANTRRWILSTANPTYFVGTANGHAYDGIGSLPHTGPDNAWPLAITMRSLTLDASSLHGKTCLLRQVCMLTESLLDAACAEDDIESRSVCLYMHESFNVNDPSEFTRPWFAWANALYSELLINRQEDIAAAIQSGATCAMTCDEFPNPPALE